MDNVELEEFSPGAVHGAKEPKPSTDRLLCCLHGTRDGIFSKLLPTLITRRLRMEFSWNVTDAPLVLLTSYVE